MKHIITVVAISGMLIGLGGCGRTPGQRAVSGGLIGAAGGAGIAAATGGAPLAGALIGGGAGALTGAVTAPRRW